jgi:hypothetical protein
MLLLRHRFHVFFLDVQYLFFLVMNTGKFVLFSSPVDLCISSNFWTLCFSFYFLLNILLIFFIFHCFIFSNNDFYAYWHHRKVTDS